MNKVDAGSPGIIVIKPSSGWQIINFKELREYRDLFYFMVWRNIKILYAQTILGFSWAILQPLIQIVVFTLIFSKVAKVPTDGIPYVLFSSLALVPWNYMSQSVTQASESLVAGQNMLGKVYFPRLIFPITPILARLIDFSISLVIILAIGLYYRVMPTWNLLYFPLMLLFMVSVSAGVGMWLSAMAIRFRDVKLAMPFCIRMFMYSAPIVYSASSIPETYRFIYSLNPAVGVIEGFRATFLGTPMPWPYVLPGFVTGMLVLVSGALYFKKMERVFADVI
jgi:lipopolysaccharide transport system permease protein